MHPFRIAAAGIVLHNNTILLVRYTAPNGTSYLVGPGGGVDSEEDVHQALIREVHEETRLEVKPIKLLFIEDLLSQKNRMLKLWFLCQYTGGTLTQQTDEANTEGIVEVSWYNKEQLTNETVYPALIKELDWSTLARNDFQVCYLPMQRVTF